MMEHLLERISLTQYKECFILKGGMLIAAHVGLRLPKHANIEALKVC